MTTVPGTGTQARRGIALLALLAAAALPGCGGDGSGDGARPGRAGPERSERAVRSRASARVDAPPAAVAAVRALPVEALAARVLVVAVPGGGPRPGRLGPAAWGGALGARPAGASWVLAEARELGLPAPRALAARSPAALKAEVTAAARAARARGVRAVLAPPADVTVTAGALEARAFADEPRRVTRLAGTMADGLTAGGLQPVPGSFPGQGSASSDPALGPATIGLTLPELRRRDLRPFRVLLRSAGAVQLSNALLAAYDGVTPAALLRPVAVGLLRGELGFRGAAVSPELGALVEATGLAPGRAAVAALAAGTDLVLVDGSAADARAVWAAVVAAVAEDRLSRARLVEAAARGWALRRGRP